MKKTVLILFAMIMVRVLVFAQGYSQKFEEAVGLLPAAPNATAITKYGGVNVSLNKGMVSHSYSFFDFKLKGLNFSVAAQYSANGYRVSEYASRIGKHWTLQAGGVISRTVYGHPDEGSTRLNLPPTGETHNQAFYDYLIDAVGGTSYDTAPDHFSFNFNGYSGKFVLDSNRHPVLLSASAIKIENTFNPASSWTFKVTTPDGNKYYFGGDAGTEETRSETTCGKPYHLFVPTSWYLTKIETPHGAIVNFQYESRDFIFYPGVSQSMYIDANGSESCLDEEGNQKPCPSYVSQGSTCISVLRSQGKYLSGISVPGYGQLQLMTTNRTDCDDVLYTEISLYQGMSAFSGYMLTYNTHNSTPFLADINKWSNGTNLTERTKFEYLNTGLVPDMNTFSQDHWGYYNGANNSSLIPPPESYFTQLQFPQATADRSADPVYASVGMLKKIIYPTGGYDTIEYEGNDYNETKTVQPPKTTSGAEVTGTGIFTQVIAQSASFTSSIVQEVKLNIEVKNLTGGPYDIIHNKGSVTIETVSGGTQVFYEAFNPGTIVTRTFSLGAGTYRIVVSANGSIVKTIATLHYRVGSPSLQNINSPTAGVRVKKVTTHSLSPAPPQIKKYYYHQPAAPAKSSGGWQNPPEFYSNSFLSRDFCSYLSAYYYRYCGHAGLFSSSQMPLLFYDGGVSYAAVTEGIGENFENGSVEHLYHVEPDEIATRLSGDKLQGAPMSNTAKLDGMERQTSIYRMHNTQLELVKRTMTSYKSDPRGFLNTEGSLVNRKYQNYIIYGGGPAATDFEEFDVAGYKNNTTWIYADTVTQIDYDTDAASPRTTRTIYQYDNPDHKQLSKTITILSDGMISEVVNKYPGDYPAITALDTLSVAVKNLQTKHLVNVPVERVSYLKDANGSNSRLTGAMFNLFRVDSVDIKEIWQPEPGNPITNFTPSTVASGKVNVDARYRKQVLFEKYDGLGNILQQSQFNDIKKTYIWDYDNKLPIAEASNATVDQIAFTSFEADGTGNWTRTGTVINGGVSGKKAFNGSLSKTVPSGNYIVTAWKTTASTLTVNSTTGNLVTTINGWQLYSWLLTNQTSITVAGTNMDEVRLHPATAQMVTLTHEPLVGVTTQADVNNVITYYEYDGSERLTVVRDQFRNILKKICYNLYGQLEDCIGNTAPAWIVTGVTRCKPCPADANYTTNIKQRQEYDNNLQSPTGNSVRWVDLESGTCTVPADWTNTVTALRCQKDQNNQNTGYQEREQKDLNPCSPTYNQLRWVVAGLNPGVCPPPVPCNSGNCSGANKKCINNVCETGVKIYVACEHVTHSVYLHTYQYRWSDGSWSTSYTEINNSPCVEN